MHHTFYLFIQARYLARMNDAARYYVTWRNAQRWQAGWQWDAILSMTIQTLLTHDKWREY